MKFKAIIFDLDGVIVSTDRYHFEAWSEIAKQEGIHFDERVNHRLRGVSRMESLDIILEKSQKSYSNDEKLKLAEQKNDVYRKLLGHISKDHLLPDVKQTISTLREKGCKLAIGSSSKNALIILKRIGLEGWFDAVADGNEIKNSKPDPEVFLLAAHKLGVDPEVCLVVEDAEAGIMAAKQGGMVAAAVGDARDCQLTDYKLESVKETIQIIFGNE